MVEKTLLLVKPEAEDAVSEIEMLVNAQGLTVVEKKKILVTRSMIEEIYTHIPSPIINLTSLHFADHVCTVLLIEGEDAIGKILTITGKELAPSHCDRNSIRYMYGIREPIRMGSFLYWKNAVHRPRNKEEADLNMKVFGFS